ncbi:GrlR family regulatory protein [Bradyrhizobium sp. STM 3562]|uniref:GrlR family regulatory protein n=1 Tax=Bradyrhizobium sp. STM 3562 TaxID=578924 RepID=UPI00388E881B
MFGGFYTVQFQLDEAIGRSVMYARAGKMLGGNSAFAHVGAYEEIDGEVAIEVKTIRHNPDPNYPAMAGTDDATLLARGRPGGALYHFEGRLNELPQAVFRAVLTPVEELLLPIAGRVGEGGISNGLYSIHIRTLDGVDGGLTGVMLLNDGRILDACFYYLGTYTSENGRWKGQILNREHTPTRGDNPIFGGHEVGIGFSGTCDGEEALWGATALVGKRSLRLNAVLRLMRRL